MMETVAVPKDLLIEVLNLALSDNYSVEDERVCTKEGHEECAKERARIYRLFEYIGVDPE